jgi:hypothetical protein
MGRVNNLIIVQRSKTLPDNLRTVFRNEGYFSNTAFNAKAVLQKIDELKLAYIVVDCGEEAGEAQATLRELLSESEVALFPVVLMSSADEDPPEELCSKFLNLTTLSYPVYSHEVLDVLKQFDRDLDLYIEKLAKIAPERVPENIPPPIEEEPGADPLAFQDDFSGAIFSKFDDFELHAKPLGGALFCQEVTFDLLEVRSLVPKNPGHKELLDDVIASVPKNVHKDIFSRILIGGQTSSVLPVSDELLEVGLLAMYALPSGFAEKIGLFSINYLNPGYNPVRDEVSKFMNLSADFAAAGLPEMTAPLIREMAGIIGGKQKAKDTEESILASTLVAADLADRACREKGAWHPRLTYVFMSKLFRGDFSYLHPTSLALLLKFLGETISNTTPVHLVPKHLRGNTKYLNEHKRARKAEVSDGEQKLPIARLLPGMRLSRPVVGYDGATLLPEEVVLDEDMILRLWRLSTVKILNTPVIIYTQ